MLKLHSGTVRAIHKDLRSRTPSQTRLAKKVQSSCDPADSAPNELLNSLPVAWMTAAAVSLSLVTSVAVHEPALGLEEVRVQNLNSSLEILSPTTDRHLPEASLFLEVADAEQTLSKCPDFTGLRYAVLHPEQRRT